MPLPLPVLDRLTFDELVAEARASLPALAPDWTDYNAHDPGITLIELLAWLAEGASYRLDNIPDEAYRAFLRLAGVEQRPAQVAEAMLVLAPVTAALPVSEGLRIKSGNGETEFQTTVPLHVSDARLAVVLSGTATGIEDLTTLHAAGSALLMPFGMRPTVGCALYLGFDRPLAPDGSSLSLGVWTDNPAADHVTRLRLAAEQQAVEDERARLCPEGQQAACIDWCRHYSVRTVWEYYAATGQWVSLKDVVDETRALTLSGTVRFTAPDDHQSGGAGGAADAGKYFIRCRLAHGGVDCPPRIAHVALNAVPARHAVAVPSQIFHHSTGQAAQRFDLDHWPVVAGSTKISITLNGVADDAWQAVPTWDGVGPHGRDCILDAEAGSLIFGDGGIGRVPPAGADITVDYQVGGGVSGNVAAGTLVEFAIARTDVTVEQPFAAYGGVDAETLDAAKARAVRELATPTRAVTLEDFEKLALATPGVPLARAHAIADYHPEMPCIPVGGSVTVIVLPPCPDQRPEPTPALLATVHRYLERRRVLTGETHVIGPHYTTVAVSARLQARPDADRRALTRQAQATLERFFHPLHGGPEGLGWPIGRAIYRSEVLALLNGLDGVLYVEEMTWRVDGKEAGCCGNITICRHGLVASGTHEITINEGSGCHE